MNYVIENSLASGSTGKVKKGTCLNKTYAIKIISKLKKEEKDIQKEIKILSMIKHKNIIKLKDYYKDEQNYYLVMKLAEIELFDMIEPEEGLNVTLVHFYFRQLLSAVSYLYSNGIVHRDIKPENILLDEKGNLILTDFGSATLFIYKERKRILRSIVGSYRYMAPEVLAEHYDQSVDLWSMGILLFVMLTGITLWEKPTVDDENFANYIQMRNHDYFPFTKLSKPMLKLFKRLCSYRSINRIKILELENEEWLAKKSVLEDFYGNCSDKSFLLDYISPKIVKRAAFSQPENVVMKHRCNNFIASQPNYNNFDLPSLKRIYCEKPKSLIFNDIQKILDIMFVSFFVESFNIGFSTFDKYKNELKGEIQIEDLKQYCCVSFVRLKGDCIEFRRFFNAVNDALQK
ncbi:Chk1 protein kinase [Conglomerata obtusa]